MSVRMDVGSLGAGLYICAFQGNELEMSRVLNSSLFLRSEGRHHLPCVVRLLSSRRHMDESSRPWVKAIHDWHSS
jgi:hypothetical protein